VAGPGASAGEKAAAVEVHSRRSLSHQAFAKTPRGPERLLSLEESVVPVRYGFRRFGEGMTSTRTTSRRCSRTWADDFLESGDLDEAMDRLLAAKDSPPRAASVSRELRESSNGPVDSGANLNNRPTPTGRCALRRLLEEIEAIESTNSTSLLSEPTPQRPASAKR